jgi:rod shape-determining protein MreC
MFRSSYFIAGVAMLALAVGGLFLSEPGHDRVSGWSLQFFSGPQRGIDWIKRKADDFSNAFMTVGELESEVGKLREEKARLGAENIALRAVAMEAASLKEQLAFKEDSPYDLLACRVIDRDLSNWWNAVVINRGRKDDPRLEVGQPVITARGVVGLTKQVADYTTRVLLIVDGSFQVSAVTGTSRARGIISGDTTINGGTPSCRFTFVAREQEFFENELVFTSGLGGKFPPNLPIGTVMEAPPLTNDRNFGLYREGRIEPSADLNDLRDVFVVLVDEPDAARRKASVKTK